ncbi:MAG TPA: hypothetical protein PKC99_18290 [Anaerolineales bacterium]|nr:ATP-binding protein [Chloroflexota bacterium]NOG76889.1 ATP-binding protein [Chloroflexota bacterium]WKZ53418.1 MAG: hypothetical protein QY324_11350 [Anaerolineales bacterium]GIK11211.1 MAG: hypothetical protein BroJett001_32770 [Chloroflexota bacterium]HMN00956.1 hypothetical protein [Anaerolineales bacterium]
MGNTNPSSYVHPVSKDQSEEIEKQDWQAIRVKAEKVFSAFLLIFSGTMFIATIAWIICAAIIWPTENSRYFRNSVEIDSNRYLEIWGPKVVPGDKEFIEVQFTLRQSSVAPEVISLEMTIPPQLVVISPINLENSQKIELQFGAATQETRVIQIASAHVVKGIGAHETQIIIYQKSPVEKEVGSFSLAPEGMLRAVILRYGGGGSQIPLFPLTTLFLSVAAFFYQERGRQKLEEETKQEAAKSTIQEIRNRIKRGQPIAARNFLKSLEQDNMQNYVKEDLSTIQTLLKITDGDLDNIPNQSAFEGWLDEYAGTLRYLAENAPKDRRALEIQLREFPLDKIKDTTTRDALESVKQVIKETRIPTQTREPNFPPESNFPQFAFLVDDSLVDDEDSKEKRFPKENPFPFEKAEDDESLLFAENDALFWSEHPLINTLKTARGAILVSGETGSGKTALAKALGNYYPRLLGTPQTFACYLSGTPTMEEIHSVLARQLLNFVERLPSFLILLNGEQRKLLGQTLVVKLGKDLVSGRLGYALNTSLWKWLDKAKSADIRRIWEAEAKTHLHMLLDSVNEAMPYAWSDRQWMFALATCIQSLDFDKSAYIIFDAENKFSWNWYAETILSSEPSWSDIGFYTVTFRAAQKYPQEKKHDRARIFELKWDKQQLKDWAHWRWEKVYNKRKEGILFDDPELLDALLNASQKNPRCFIRLWNTLVETKQTLHVTKKDIENVKETTDCI